MEYEIRKNSLEGEIVLDPFCGSGSVGLESVLNGRNFIGYDLNPFAIKLCESTLASNFDIEIFDSSLSKIIEMTKKEIMELYRHESDFVLYSIPGSGNKQNYNIVLCDLEFNKVGQIQVPDYVVNYGITENDNIEIPDQDFPAKFYKDRFSYKGVKKVSDLFSTRSLIALTILRRAISTLPEEAKLDFTLILTNTLLHISKLKSEKVRPLGVNNYWIPDDYIEENVLWRFLDRAKQYQIAKNEIQSRFKERDNLRIGSHDLRKKSSIPMLDIDSNSIDYILTDPPYGDVIQYSELSFVWNVWIEELQDYTSELIVNPVQNKDDEYFLKQLEFFVEDCFRVLKPTRKLTLCFQNKDPKVWFNVAYIARNAGFVLSEIETFDFLGSTFNKNWSKNSPKVDLYVTLEKPKRATNKISIESEISLATLFELHSLELDVKEISQVNDAYSKLIAIGITQIFRGFKIVDFTKSEFERFLSSNNEDVIEDAKYIQGGLF